MKIESICAQFPERVVTNEEIISMVRESSQHIFEDDLEAMLNSITYLLNYSGAEQRRWVKPGENCFDHVEIAVNKALNQAGMTKADIELVIFSSVDKRVLEPATAALIAGALGFQNIQCFDVLEACNSWSRATDIAQAFLQTNRVKTVLIITSEFGMHENKWSKNNYALKKADDIEWAFAAYTIGESATATILTRDESNPWQYRFIGNPASANICLLPLDDFPPDMSVYNQFNINGVGPRRFMSLSKELGRAAWQPLCELLKTHEEKIRDAAIVFPHNHSKKYWIDMAKELNMEIPFYFSYPQYGNLVTASIPGSMALAIEEKQLKRGDSVFVIMGAAGVSCAAYSFRY